MLVLSQYVEASYAGDLLTDGSGAVGYLLKDRVARVGEFLDALGRVARGATVLDPQVIAQLLAGQRRDNALGNADCARTAAPGAESGGAFQHGRRPATGDLRQRRGKTHQQRLRQARPAARRRPAPPGARRPRLPQGLTAALGAVCSGLDPRLGGQLTWQERHQNGPGCPVGNLDDLVLGDIDHDRGLPRSGPVKVPIGHLQLVSAEF